MARSFLLFLVLLMSAGCWAQVRNFDTVFPYCDCIRPTGPNNSPYAMSRRPTVTRPNGVTKMCWKLTATASSTGRCSKFDLRKLEMNIKTECRSAIDTVLFGNRVLSPSYTYYSKPKALVFKITGGNKDDVLGNFTSLVGKTTTVCITMKPATKCISRQTFCRRGICDYAFFSPDDKCCPGNFFNSPPPPADVSIPIPSPSPPAEVSAFPYCACDRTPVFNSYSLSPSDSAPVATKVNGLNKYCWTLDATRYSGSSRNCVNFDLKKIEWDIKKECDGSVVSATLDKDVIAASYSRYPQGTTYKFTRGDRDLISLSTLVSKPARLCVTLAKKCPTLASFCKTPFCRVAFFSSNNKCCPLDSLVNSA